MALKTNYKDAAWTGDRLYTIADAGSGKSTITDETEYTVEGDVFGAKDINETNAAINRLTKEPTWVTLKASGWNGSAAPYTQKVSVEGITADDYPVLVSGLADGASAEATKAYNKAFALVAAAPGVTAAGSVTFKVYKKPTIDIRVGLKGV